MLTKFLFLTEIFIFKEKTLKKIRTQIFEQKLKQKMKNCHSNFDKNLFIFRIQFESKSGVPKYFTKQFFHQKK